jgi:hypothetical protein
MNNQTASAVAFYISCYKKIYSHHNLYFTITLYVSWNQRCINDACENVCWTEANTRLYKMYKDLIWAKLFCDVLSFPYSCRTWREMSKIFCTQYFSPSIRSKSYWDNRINAPLIPNSMLCGWLKREHLTHFFQHWSWGQGGGRRTLKWPKNVKSLIIFARDCLRWSCLGVSCPKFKILPKSSDQDDMRLTYFNQLTESFLSPKM